MRILITGISGFVGSWLAEDYLASDHEVIGIHRWRSKLDNLQKIKDQVQLYPCDVADSVAVSRLLKTVGPVDVIHHLAAQSYVPYSWSNPVDFLTTNGIGTLYFLEALKDDKETVLHVVSSSEAYGRVEPFELPITESQPLRPLSPYGLSKALADMAAQQYHASYGVHVIITRAFNHEGVRRGPEFVTSRIVKQAVEIKRGERRYFELGNTSAVRDFSDVRDIVTAYRFAAIEGMCEYGTPYNICSEQGTVISELCDMARIAADIDETIEVKVKDSLLRPSDVPRLVGSAAKFRAATHWKPQYSIKDTIQWMVSEELKK